MTESYIHVISFYQRDNLEYNRYLKEVVSVLESDEDFMKRISKMAPEELEVKFALILNE